MTHREEEAGGDRLQRKMEEWPQCRRAKAVGGSEAEEEARGLAESVPDSRAESAAEVRGQGGRILSSQAAAAEWGKVGVARRQEHRRCCATHHGVTAQSPLSGVLAQAPCFDWLKIARSTALRRRASWPASNRVRALHRQRTQIRQSRQVCPCGRCASGTTRTRRTLGRCVPVPPRSGRPAAQARRESALAVNVTSVTPMSHAGAE
mmetsp:Transcript_16959/g.47305  ORF Transcript_16959/g.47305 Transcript_16959/m.47305 type:complete len:206 (+) Transcript_16959:946-1563(+)